MKYGDFINLGYKPSPSDLIALFRVEPAKGFDIYDASARIAAESSVGTWSEIKVDEFVSKISAKVFMIKGKWIYIAYPIELFEEGNMSQILSSIAGNIFGMKAIKNIRLEDVSWPIEIKKWFRGSRFGIKGVRDILRIYDRPILATVPKPKVGLTLDRYIEVASDIWRGGIDLVKDDENLTGQSFNKFEERLKKMLRLRDKIENETGERKGYLVNITAPYNEMVRRAKLVKDYNGEFIMIDILTTGFSSVQSIIDDYSWDAGIAIHAHRAFHAAFTRNPRHGLSMKVIAEIFRILGVDHIHVGTVLGKLHSPYSEVRSLIAICREEVVRESSRRKLLYNDWRNIKEIFPVSSGGLHPGLIPSILKIFGYDVIIQVGGGVAGHPDGFYSGAKAVRLTVDGLIEGKTLDEIRSKYPVVDKALKTWGFKSPT